MLSIPLVRDPWGTNFGAVEQSQSSSAWSVHEIAELAKTTPPRPVGRAALHDLNDPSSSSSGNNNWQLFSNTTFAANIADEFVGGTSFGSSISDATSFLSDSSFTADGLDSSTSSFASSPLQDLCNSVSSETEQTTRSFPTIASLSISALSFSPSPKASPWHTATPAASASTAPIMPQASRRTQQQPAAGTTLQKSRQKTRSGHPELKYDLRHQQKKGGSASKENQEPTATKLQWGAQPTLEPPPMLPKRKDKGFDSVRARCKTTYNTKSKKKADKVSKLSPASLSSSSSSGAAHSPSSKKNSKPCKVCKTNLPKTAFVEKQWSKSRSCCMSCAASKSDAAELYFIEASVRGQMLRDEIPSVKCVRCKSDKPGTAFPDGLFTFAAAFMEGKQITQHNQGNPLLNAICLRCSGRSHNNGDGGVGDSCAPDV